MNIDRTTKFLLAVLAIGIWGLLLKPTVLPAQAQQIPPGPAEFTPALALGNDGVYVAVPNGQSGSIFRFEGKLGKPAFVGHYASH